MIPIFYGYSNRFTKYNGKLYYEGRLFEHPDKFYFVDYCQYYVANKNICCCCCKKIDPIPCMLCPLPQCDNLDKGVAVRYRNFSGNQAQKSIYLIKNAFNQNNVVQGDYNWNVNPNTISYYNFRFTYNRSIDQISQLLNNANPLSFDLNGTVNFAPLNAIEVIVNNLEANQNNVVTLTNAFLKTSVGKYPFPDISPESGKYSITFYKWPNDGSVPANGFTITGTIGLKGVFISAESSKVEMSVVGYKCDPLRNTGVVLPPEIYDD